METPGQKQKNLQLDKRNDPSRENMDKLRRAVPNQTLFWQYFYCSVSIYDPKANL